jgi:glutathione S-transferase
MQLYYSPFSPFARKCRILIREKGMRVEEIVIDPLKSGADYTRINPMSQVPSLVDDAGIVWTDSPLICQRLDALGGGARFIPDGEARWDVLRREVIADGIMELGVKWRLETVRPEGERSASWMEKWRAGVLRSIAVAEAQASDAFDLGAIASVCALTWLDFRFPSLGWREAQPKLAALQAELEQRPSFRDTAPAQAH